MCVCVCVCVCVCCVADSHQHNNTHRLCNRGVEAYKPDQYGDSITIIRTISVTGVSHYEFKNHNLALVSTVRRTSFCFFFLGKREHILSQHFLLLLEKRWNFCLFWHIF